MLCLCQAILWTYLPLPEVLNYLNLSISITASTTFNILSTDKQSLLLVNNQQSLEDVSCIYMLRSHLQPLFWFVWLPLLLSSFFFEVFLLIFPPQFPAARKIITSSHFAAHPPFSFVSSKMRLRHVSDLSLNFTPLHSAPVAAWKWTFTEVLSPAALSGT